jgi:hypothetical protein
MSDRLIIQEDMNGKRERVKSLDFGRFIAGKTEVKKTMYFIGGKDGICDLKLAVTEASPDLQILVNGFEIKKGDSFTVLNDQEKPVLAEGQVSKPVVIVVKSTENIDGGTHNLRFSAEYLWPA